MATPASFQGMSSSVLPSQEREVLVAKQAAMSGHGQEVRLALTRLPPSVTDSIMAEYREPAPATLQALTEAIALREQVIESVEQGRNLDIDWASGGGSGGRHINEKNLGADDPWNEAPSF